MSSLKLFCVTFDRPNATYEAGETVSGKIIIDTTKDKEVKGLYFIASGSSLVHSVEGDQRDDSGSQNFTSTEPYFYFKNDIFGIQEHEEWHKIPFGYHQYSFSFQLPYNIPCSFEHTRGYVRYTVKAVMDGPWKFNHECKAAFSVISQLNLNDHLDKCYTITDVMSKTFNCLCWLGQGSMNLQITVPASGYVPGQTINTMVKFTSSPNIPIRKVTTKLLRKVTLHTPSKTLTDVDVVQKSCLFQPFPPNGRITSELLVPPIPPSYLQHCNIINIDYELIVSIHVSEPYSKIKRNYPIVIGTAPLYRPTMPRIYIDISNRISRLISSSGTTVVVSMPGQSSEPDLPTVPTEDQANVSSVHESIPPPSYEECMYGTQSIRDASDSEFVFGANDPFAPRYPVFNYPAPSIPQ